MWSAWLPQAEQFSYGVERRAEGCDGTIDGRVAAFAGWLLLDFIRLGPEGAKRAENERSYEAGRASPQVAGPVTSYDSAPEGRDGPRTASRMKRHEVPRAFLQLGGSATSYDSASEGQNGPETGGRMKWAVRFRRSAAVGLHTTRPRKGKTGRKRAVV